MTKYKSVYYEDGTMEWVKVEPGQDSIKADTEINRRMPAGEDLTIDGYINKYGGIKSIIDGSVHTSNRSYQEHIKKNNLIIRDW